MQVPLLRTSTPEVTTYRDLNEAMATPQGMPIASISMAEDVIIISDESTSVEWKGTSKSSAEAACLKKKAEG